MLGVLVCAGLGLVVASADPQTRGQPSALPRRASPHVPAVERKAGRDPGDAHEPSYWGTIDYSFYPDALEPSIQIALDQGEWQFLYPPITQRIHGCSSGAFFQVFVPPAFTYIIEDPTVPAVSPDPAEGRERIGAFGEQCLGLVAGGVVTTEYAYTCDGGPPRPMMEPFTLEAAARLCGLPSVSEIRPVDNTTWDARSG